MHGQMHKEAILEWVQGSATRQQIVASLPQPATAGQISSALSIRRRQVSDVLRVLTARALMKCVNQTARKNRVYWFTELGTSIQRRLRIQLELPSLRHGFPDVNWDIYGLTINKRYSAVLKAMVRPMHVAAIRRFALGQNPNLRMCRNNIYDAMKVLRKLRLVRLLWIRSKKHPLVELSEEGRRVRTLLSRSRRDLGRMERNPH